MRFPRGRRREDDAASICFLFFFDDDEREEVEEIEAKRQKNFSLSIVSCWPMLSRGSSSSPRFARLFPLLTTTMSSNATTKKRPAFAEAKAPPSSSPRTPSIRKRIAPSSTPTPTTPAPPLEQQPPRPPPPWTRDSLAAAARSLASLDPSLAALIEEHGVPFEKLLPKTATATAAAATAATTAAAATGKEEEEEDEALPPPPPPHHHFATLARAVVGQQVSGAAAATIYARVLSVCCGGVDALEEIRAVGRNNDGNSRTKGKGGCVVAAAASQQQQRQQLLLTPEALLAAPPELLRAAGLSERKASYLVGLAEKFSEGGEEQGKQQLRLDRRLDELAAAGDADAVAAELVSIRGVGLWTAHMHLIFHMGSPDVLPVGDLGIKKGFAKLFGGGRGGGGSGGGGGGGGGGKKGGSSASLPTEARMLELAEPFRPHRSLLSYYLWRAAG